MATAAQLSSARHAILQVKAAEEQLADRQRDLANMVTEANSFLQQERRSRKVARRCVQNPVGFGNCIQLPTGIQFGQLLIVADTPHIIHDMCC